VDNSNRDSYESLPWIPKKAFYSLAEYYKSEG
jgi:hypothetical protein